MNQLIRTAPLHSAALLCDRPGRAGMPVVSSGAEEMLICFVQGKLRCPVAARMPVVSSGAEEMLICFVRGKLKCPVAMAEKWHPSSVG